MTEHEAQRLAKIDEKMKQMKAQRQDILARDKKRQRQERTRRLIQIGALSEKYFGVTDIQPTDYEVFLKALLAIQGATESIAHAKAKGASNSQHEQRTDTESATNEPSGIPN